MPVGSQEFRAALGHFASSSVNVVTAQLADGQLAGITVNAFSSSLAAAAAGDGLHR